MFEQGEVLDNVWVQTCTQDIQCLPKCFVTAWMKSRECGTRGRMTQPDFPNIAETPPLISLGFESAVQTPMEQALSVSGSIPLWLEGRLLRTGPAIFELPLGRYDYWFDGLAMLTCCRFFAGTAAYQSRFLDSDAYRRAVRRGRPHYDEFGTHPAKSKLRNLLSLLRRPRVTDNANVNIANIGSQVIAMTETFRHVAFDPKTLQTLGEVKYEDSLEGVLSTAHPQIDRQRNVLYNVMTYFGRKSAYEIYELALGEQQRKLLTRLHADKPSYIHSFAATDQFLVLTEIPLCAPPLRMRLSSKPFLNRYEWLAEQGTQVRLIRKADGEVVGSAQVPPFFCFHHVNAFEEGNRVCVDLLVYPDASIMHAVRLETLREGRAPQTTASLVRLALTLGRFDQTCDLEPLSQTYLELPRINPKYEQRMHRYVYGVGQVQPQTFFDQIVRIDTQQGLTKSFQREGWYPNEPVFVAAPFARSEDEGVLIAIVLDVAARASRLVILDAASLELLAHAQLPQVVPFHFHGQFFSES